MHRERAWAAPGVRPVQAVLPECARDRRTLFLHQGPAMTEQQPITTRTHTRVLIRNVLFAVVCLGLALWGWYDLEVTIPREREVYAAYQELDAHRTELEDVAAHRPLTDQEIAELEAVRERLNEIGTPSAPSKYDEAVQIWLYIVGCGVLGTPWFLFDLWRTARQRFQLDAAGALHLPDGRVWAADDIADIDMSRWMRRSTATVRHRDGQAVTIDDYRLRNAHLIVGALAHRFYPDDWTTDARPTPPADEHPGTAGSPGAEGDAAAEDESSGRSDQEVDSSLREN